MASREETSWTDDMEDLFDDISFEEEQDQSKEDVSEDVNSEMNDFLSGDLTANDSASGPLGSGMTKLDYEDVVLDSAEAADNRLELIRRVHPDHAGSNELFRAHERLKQDGLIEEYFESEQTNEQENKADEAFSNQLGLPGFQNNEYREALDMAPNQETAIDLINYEGNVDMARKVLETEWKIDNAAQYLGSEMFSEGSLAGEAELILGELDEENRKDTIQQLVEENRIYEEVSENITSTWFQNDTLMGYDEEKGHNVRLDFYDDIKASADDNKQVLSSMIEDTKEGLEDYELGALKSVNYADGSIDDRLLEDYLSSQGFLT